MAIRCVYKGSCLLPGMVKLLKPALPEQLFPHMSSRLSMPADAL
jgi:hypothetical protein